MAKLNCLQSLILMWKFFQSKPSAFLWVTTKLLPTCYFTIVLIKWLKYFIREEKIMVVMMISYDSFLTWSVFYFWSNFTFRSLVKQLHVFAKKREASKKNGHQTIDEYFLVPNSHWNQCRRQEISLLSVLYIILPTWWLKILELWFSKSMTVDGHISLHIFWCQIKYFSWETSANNCEYLM